MLRVSDAQFAALQAHFAAEFIERMTRELFASFPVECNSQGRVAVADFVRASIDRARSDTIGATLESDFRRFVVTEFVMGVETTDNVVASERQRLTERDGDVDPTILIFLTYQAMLARIMPKGPPPPPDPEYEAIA
jgi:hypothetical protein